MGDKFIKMNSIIIYLQISLLFLLSSIVFAQQSSWKVLDEEMNKSIIIDYRLELDKYNQEKEIEASDERPLNNDKLVISPSGDSLNILSVSYDRDGETTLRQVAFKSEIQNRIDPKLMQVLKSKRYEWDDLNYKYNEVSGINIYKYKDYKKVRDVFWWSYSNIDFSPFLYDNAVAVRPIDPIAFITKSGFEEMGFPSYMSNNTSWIISSEQTQMFINTPFRFSSMKLTEVHPLESSSGIGLRFDLNRFGGEISQYNIDDLTYEKSYNPNHIVSANSHSQFYISFANEVFPTIIGPKSIDSDNETAKFPPPGVQRTKVGISYIKLQYGKIDSLSNYIALDETDFDQSVKVFFRWEYVSNESVLPDRARYRPFSRMKGFVQANIGKELAVNAGFFYSISPSIKLGFNLAYAQPVDFNIDGKTYSWKPGFIISPNIVWSR